MENVDLGYMFLHGGYAYNGYGNSNGNILNVRDAYVAHIHGGHAHYGTANYNIVNFYSGTVSSEIGAGYSDYSDVNHNTLNIYDGTISGTVYGGRASYGGRGGDAIGNTLNIYGGTISGDVYGGWAEDGNSNDNTLNIYGSPDLTNARLYAGTSSPTGTSTGNTLNIYTSGITARNIGGFEKLNFILPSTIQNGETVLTLTDSNTDLALTRVGLGIGGSANVNTGDTYNLLRNANGLTISDATLADNGVMDTTLSRGISMDYDASLSLSEDGNSIIATVGEGRGLNADTQILPKTQEIVNLQVVNNAADNLLSSFETFVEEDPFGAPPIKEPQGFEVFANMGRGHIKTKTGDGTNVRTTSNTIDLGFARTLESEVNRLVVAPIIENANGDYDSTLKNGLEGHGRSRYTAGGVIARNMNRNGIYYEGSLRAGRTRNNFASNDMKMAGDPVRVTYHTSTSVYSGHVRLGNIKRLNRDNILDVYGIYSYARQSGTNADLSTGEHYDFDSVDSHRARLGYRMTTRTSRISRVYTGLAYQYEKNSDAVATYESYRTPTVGAKGSSGMLELGWQIKPLKDNPWMVNLYANGWVGHQQGLQAMAKMQKAF